MKREDSGRYRRMLRDQRKNGRYGAAHRKLRAYFDARVQAGLEYCRRPECGELIVPGTPWDLGHDERTGGYRGPEHASCNRAAPNRCVTSRVW